MMLYELIGKRRRQRRVSGTLSLWARCATSTRTDATSAATSGGGKNNRGGTNGDNPECDPREAARPQGFPQEVRRRHRDRHVRHRAEGLRGGAGEYRRPLSGHWKF